MTVFTYSRVPAFNPNTSPVSLARSASGSVYDVGDTAFTTPLNMTMVATGAVTTTLLSDANGMFPDFTLVDRTSVVFKSGAQKFVLTTTTPVPGPQGEPGPASTVPGPPTTDASLLAAGTLADARLPARLQDDQLSATILDKIKTDSVPRWKPLTAYLVGDVALNPSGDTVTANAAFTSGSTYDATKWNLSAAYPKVGVFENFTVANFRKFRAAVARGRVGLAPAAVMHIGDSNAAGFRAVIGNDYARSPGERARSISDGALGPARTGWVFPRIAGGTFARLDQRVTLGTGWSLLDDATVGPAGLGAAQGVGTTAGSLVYTPTETADTYTVLLKQDPAAPTSVTVNLPGVGPGTPPVRDSFTRTGAVGSPEAGGTAYEVTSGTTGTWTVDGSKLVGSRNAVSSNTPLIIVTDPGTLDGSWSAKFGGDLHDRLVFRYQDTNNHLGVGKNGSSKYTIFKQSAGLPSTVATSTVTAAANDTVMVSLAGSRIRVYINGVQALDVTDASFAASQKVGVANSNPAAVTTSFDDFQFSPVGATNVSLRGTAGVKAVMVSAPTPGLYPVNVTVNSADGTALVLALKAAKASTAGTEWTLIGRNGSTAAEWVAVQSAAWGSQNILWNLMAPNLTIINLMINAHNGAQTVASYKSQMAELINSAKAVSDVILIASAPGGTGDTTNWGGYLTALRELAASKGCGLINMQERWGDYALANGAAYQLWGDPDHPSDAGYWDLGQAMSDAIKLAAGRSA